MIWRRRCLVLVPVLSFLAAALIMSCGGGSSSSTTTAVNNLTVVGLNVCAGPPPTPTTKPTPTPSPTPKPTPTPKSSLAADDAASQAVPEATKTPKPTPTPICTPIVTSAIVGTGMRDNQVQFNAQGVFALTNTSTKVKYRDVTNNTSTLWQTISPNVTFPGLIIYSGSNGLFTGVTTGCTYFTVSDAGFFQNILVGVGVNPATCPTPPGTPPTTGPPGSPTPTP
jgi:hypothetical protein